ncbi:NRT1/ PTR family 8.2-like protein [Tanacetum coccineum]
MNMIYGILSSANGSLYAATQVDPVFILSPLFDEARMKNGYDQAKFRQLYEIIYLHDYPGYHHLAQISEKSMQVVCDCKGLSASIFDMASTAVVEHNRRTHFDPKNLSVFWLKFFYDEDMDGTRSAMILSKIGIRSWLSTTTVKIIEKATGKEEKGWVRNDLNMSILDYLYWILMAINALNLVIICRFAHVQGQMGASSIRSVRDEAIKDDQS